MCHAAVRVNSISIHSLHTEGDPTAFGLVCSGLHFNPLPPHGGRPKDDKKAAKALIISIHSLHTEGDLTVLAVRKCPVKFQSTPSTRRETDFS